MKAALLFLALLSANAGAAQPFVDPLDQPARASALGVKAPLSALARAGHRLVAAGQRGHVLLSDDEGESWQQATSVPLSSDLLALSFPDAQHGWACGHDGVIIATRDGGKSWQRQFDGRKLGERGAENPLLDIWFDDAQRGWAVGAFGLILSTIDGGEHWTQLPTGVADNPKSLHLYAIRGIAGRIYAVGEQGLLLRLNELNDRFEALPMPYPGTLFGITGDGSALLVHGLRGNALRSSDGGANWRPIATGLQVGLTASTTASDGSWLLASQAGHVLISHDQGQTFKPLKLERALPAATLLAGRRGLLVAGPRGVQKLQQLR